MFGGSYVGATQMLTAIGHPPHLAGICPVVTASNYHENWTYQGGAFEQWFNESWTSGLAADTLNRTVKQETNALIGSPTLPLKKYPVFNKWAVDDGAGLTRKLAPYFLDWLDHPTYDSYWKQWSIEENYANIQVPALTVAAWYDLFQAGSLRNFMGDQGSRRQRGGSQRAKASGHYRRPCRRPAQGWRVGFRSRSRGIRRRFDHVRLVRLPAQGRAESIMQPKSRSESS